MTTSSKLFETSPTLDSRLENIANNRHPDIIPGCIDVLEREVTYSNTALESSQNLKQQGFRQSCHNVGIATAGTAAFTIYAVELNILDQNAKLTPETAAIVGLVVTLGTVLYGLLRSINLGGQVRQAEQKRDYRLQLLHRAQNNAKSLGIS